MNIYDFINSKDVRRFAEKAGYRFCAPEAAFLIYHSDGKTLQEKMQAWQEIIDTMPDCRMEKRNWLEAADSFHSTLADYMELQRRKLKSFDDGDGYMYHYAVYVRTFNGEMDWDEQGSMVFSDYGTCVEYCKKYGLPEGGAEKVRIYKCRINPPGDNFYMERHGGFIELSRSLDVLQIDTCLAYDEEKYTLDLDGMFEGMCFDFPTPFKRGDIVTTHGGRECSGIPFVLSYVTTWKSGQLLSRGFGEHECPWGNDWEAFDRHREDLLKKGDSTDMHVLGIRADSGKLYQDNILIVPTDIEYFTGELEGYNRQLRAVSLHEKGKIDYELLVNSCFSIRLEEMAKEVREDCILPYRREMMEDLGVIPANSDK